MSLVASILDRLLEKKVIENCERQPYLHRWYLLRTARVAVFVHKFVRSDEDRALHDHPWPFFVLPIWRGYREHSARRNGYHMPNGWQQHNAWWKEFCE